YMARHSNCRGTKARIVKDKCGNILITTPEQQEISGELGNTFLLNLPQSEDSLPKAPFQFSRKNLPGIGDRFNCSAGFSSRRI
ncbi:unnamed protein product, partial [Allacma fusca]